MYYNLTWENSYAPRVIIDLIFSFRNSIILFVDVSKLNFNEEVFVLNPIVVIDLTLDDP